SYGVNVSSAANIFGNTVYQSGIGIYSGSGTSNIFGNVLHDNSVGLKGYGRLGGTDWIYDEVAYPWDTHVTYNDIYSNGTSGVGVHLQGSAMNVSLENNILVTDTGYCVYVDTDSQQGFSSNFNNLFKTAGGGTLVWWQKSFYDLFDWQAETGFDLNSIGYT